MSASLQSSSHGRTMVLTLCNPEQQNALGPEMYAAGIEALNVAESSPEVRAVVIAGQGPVFSIGAHLQRLLAERHETPEQHALGVEGLHSWIESIRTFPKPVIAAVEGTAAGAGFSLALSCDLIVAASNAVFAMDQGQAALSPDGGASWSLARALPRQLAAELLMLGERIGAERLHVLGVVNMVTAPGAALAEALALAERLNTRAPNALASAKELLAEAGDTSLNAQLAQERNHFVANLHHANADIALAALQGRATPHYS